MADQAPFRPQNAHEVTTLLQTLKSHKSTGNKFKKSKNGFSCKESTFTLPQLGNRQISSWKLNEWDYKRDDLPTYARGLFTYKLSDGRDQIAVRGYDKFFNINEVNDTQWQNIEARTRGPYELSNKENGCIIFIAGLENDRIVVCSKHSTGERGDASASHAVQGEKWLERHLASVGRTKQQLAQELRARNVTLVAELCDDSFEEHVLEYGPEVSGLYVHGINLNVPEFATYPFHLIQKFADEWGLKKAKYVVEDSLEGAKDFLEKCGETGSWNGRDTEGFVIRCQKQVAGQWVDWFFKYKYDEPYLMYRQWREATKAIIAGRQPKYKKHAKITEAYLLYARRQLAKDPSLGKRYGQNHGIIAMREGFLATQGVRGSDIIRAEESNGEEGGSNSTVTNNIVLMPISTIGCGKTTVANALVSLFNFGHVQNDNITGQKGRPQKFATEITMQMAQHPAVIADRNNHQKRERRQLFDDITRVAPTTRYIALHYVHDPKDQMVPKVRAVTLKRVRDRGDNHQTIRASSKESSEIEGIMDGFLNRFEPLENDAEPDNKFDFVINMDPCEDSRHNLDVVVNALHNEFPRLVPQLPTPDQLDDAIQASLNDYSPQLKHDLSFNGGGGGRGKDKQAPKDKSAKNAKNNQPNGKPKDKKKDNLEYFAVQVSPERITELLNETFARSAPQQAAFYNELQQLRRVQPKFHVTLIHRASKAQFADLWEKYEMMYHRDHEMGTAKVQLDEVVWDGRVMCIAVKVPGWESANPITHITIGTVHPSVKPVESNTLLQKWVKGEQGVHSVVLRPDVELDGVVRGVTPQTR